MFQLDSDHSKAKAEQKENKYSTTNCKPADNNTDILVTVLVGLLSSQPLQVTIQYYNRHLIQYKSSILEVSDLDQGIFELEGDSTGGERTRWEMLDKVSDKPH